MAVVQAEKLAEGQEEEEGVGRLLLLKVGEAEEEGVREEEGLSRAEAEELNF